MNEKYRLNIPESDDYETLEAQLGSDLATEADDLVIPDWMIDVKAEEETAVYNQKLAQLGITDTDIDQFQRGARTRHD